MAKHSSILAWRIPRTEEPGGLQSMDHKELDMTEQLTILRFHFHKCSLNGLLDLQCCKSMKCYKPMTIISYLVSF